MLFVNDAPMETKVNVEKNPRPERVGSESERGDGWVVRFS